MTTWKKITDKKGRRTWQIIRVAVLIISMAGVAGAYQPADGYELDATEIGWYLAELRKAPVRNAEEIVKFERILAEDIQDYVEYFIRYGKKIASKEAGK